MQRQFASLPKYTLINVGFFVLAMILGQPMDKQRIKS